MPETQYLPALESANRIKSQRVEARKEILAGNRYLYDYLDRPFMQSAYVLKVLTWIPRIGNARAEGIMLGLGMKLSATVGQLSVTRKLQLLSILYKPQDMACPSCRVDGRRVCEIRDSIGSRNMVCHFRGLGK